jgi:micrococcal nuclease
MATTDQLYVYRAKVLRVIDGDTVEVMVDLGFHVFRQEKLRLFGINSPEIVGQTHAEGIAAKRAMMGLIAGFGVTETDTLIGAADIATGNCNVVIRTRKDADDKYGRMLATITDKIGRDVNAEMIKLGFAVAYDGGAR